MNALSFKIIKLDKTGGVFPNSSKTNVYSL